MLTTLGLMAALLLGGASAQPQAKPRRPAVSDPAPHRLGIGREPVFGCYFGDLVASAVRDQAAASPNGAPVSFTADALFVDNQQLYFRRPLRPEFVFYVPPRLSNDIRSGSRLWMFCYTKAPGPRSPGENDAVISHFIAAPKSADEERPRQDELGEPRR